MKDSPAGAFAGVPNNCARSPHPVLLPLGEGTLERRFEHASPLPGGEGQGEGSELRSLRPPASSAQPSLSLPENHGGGI
jgi:hypothetical protein